MLSSLYRKPVPMLVSWRQFVREKASLASTVSRGQFSVDYEVPCAMDVKPFSAIPGPKPLPVLRNMLDFKKNLKTLNHYLERCSEEYGDIFKLEVPGGNNFVYFADPRALETILRAEGKIPKRDSTLSANLQWIFEKQNFATPLPFKLGEDWKKTRSAVNNQIKPSNVQMYTAGLNEVFGGFIDYLQSTKDRDGRISDVSWPLKRLLVASTAKIVYNADLHIFDNPTKETEEFVSAIQLLFDCILKVLVQPPFFKLYPNKVYRDIKKGFTVTTDYGMKYANEVVKMIEAGEERPVQGLLEQWLKQGKMTEREAIMSSTSMFSAGVDSTSNQAAFMLHCMARYPEVQEKLYTEIKSVLGDRTIPTPEDLAKMPYLKGCMLESFRMQPSGVFVARVLPNDVTLMGYNIPAETNIVYINSVAGKKPDIFPNPEVFDPERWARDKPHPFAHLLFGFGPRSCYGRRFAELELKLLLCHVFQKYIVKCEEEKLNVEFAAIVRPVGDLPMYFKERE